MLMLMLMLIYRIFWRGCPVRLRHFEAEGSFAKQSRVQARQAEILNINSKSKSFSIDTLQVHHFAITCSSFPEETHYMTSVY